MANQQNSLVRSDGSGTDSRDFSYTFPTFKESEVKVEIDNVVKTLTTHYTIVNHNNSSGGTVRFNATGLPDNTASTTPIRIFRQTDVDTPKAEFTAGASLKAQEINDNFKQVRHALQEAIGAVATDRKVQRFNIEADTIDGTLIADDVIDSEHYVAGSIDLEHMSADSVDGSKIADNSIDSEHYVSLSIDTQHIGNEQVTTAKLGPDAVVSSKIADDSINSEHYVDGSIDEQHLSNSAISSNKIADNAVTTTEILNGAVTNAKLATDSVTSAKITDLNVISAKIANSAVTSDKIADGAVVGAKIPNNVIDNSKMMNDAITAAEIADDAVVTAGIADNAVTEAKIAANAVTDSEIATGTLDNRYFTETELTNGALDGRYFTETESDARYFNVSTGDTIKDGDTFPDNDTTIATTAAINDRIIDLVDDVGGFVPIANELSFPNSNPDVNDGAGTLVSIKSLSQNLTSNGSGVISISNGTVGNSTVTIVGADNSTTYAAGFGLIVETHADANKYTFHRLVPKATEVTTVAGKATEIGRLGTAAAVEDMSILGTTDVVADMALLATTDVVSDMNTLAVSDVISDMNTLAVTSVVNDMDTVAGISSNVTTVAGIHGNVTTVAGISGNVTTVAGIHGNVTTVAGISSNVTTVATNNSNVTSVANNMANVNNFNDRYQIAANNPSTDGGGNALAAGDLYFNTSANELKVYNGSSWQGGVTATGSFAATTGNTFTGDNTYNDGVKALFGNSSDLEIYHDGFHYIKGATGNSMLIQNSTANIHLQPVAGENAVKAIANGAAELYYDHSKKLETYAYGVKTTGIHSIVTSDNSYLALENTAGHGTSYLRNYQGNLLVESSGNLTLELPGSEFALHAVANGAVNLYYNNVKKFETTNSGVKLPDTQKVEFGDDDDLEIFHYAADDENLINSHKPLKTLSNGNTHIQSNTAEDMIKAVPNGAVELYYDNSKKLETTTDGVTISGNKLVVGTCRIFTNGNVLLGDNNEIRFGDDEDLKIFHNSGVNYINSAVGNLYLQTGGTTKAILTSGNFKPGSNGNIDLGTSGATWQNVHATTYYGDGSNLTGINTDLVSDTSPQLGGALDTNGNDIQFADSNKAKFGDSSDLQIYHDGNHSRIKDAGTGNLNIQANTTAIQNAGGTENCAVFVENGSVELYSDGSKILETKSNGLRLFGDSTQSQIQLKTSDGTNRGYLYADNSDAVYILEAQGHLVLKGIKDGTAELYYDNSKKFETTSTGVAINGNATYNDGSKSIYGAGSDLEIYHIADQINVIRGSGPLTIQTDDTSTGIKLSSYSGGETFALFKKNGSVDLYYDNTKKFETTSSGVEVFGELQMDDANSHIKLPDNARIDVGSSNDLRIYHDGSHSHIEDAGTGNLNIASNTTAIVNAASNENIAVFKENAEVELFYDGVLKFETTSNGVQAARYSFDSDNYITCNTSANTMEFVTNGTDIGEFSPSGLMLRDNMQLRAGTGNDFRFFHDGTYNVIKGTGNHRMDFYTNNTLRTCIQSDGHLRPASNNTYDLGTSVDRWRNVYTADLQLSNEGESNDVDGTWGNYTMQEGENDLFLINNRSGKKYKFNLTEVS